MSKAAVKPAKKSFADFDMDAMDFSAVPANTEFKAAGRFQRLPLADVDPDPAQVRREFDQAEIDALAATIKDRGLRSRERRVGKECVRTGRSRLCAYH